MSFALAVTVMCGFTPPSIGPNPARSYRRSSSQNPSARRKAGVRVSLTPSFSGVGADRLDNKVIRRAPLTASKSPLTVTRP
ncbi:hypothetical protein BKP42_34220 [Rhodococcus erythropolis]|nr:hypothetical protein BKP42_34220 [Rhodococcus erythropolis]